MVCCAVASAVHPVVMIMGAWQCKACQVLVVAMLLSGGDGGGVCAQHMCLAQEKADVSGAVARLAGCLVLRLDCWLDRQAGSVMSHACSNGVGGGAFCSRRHRCCICETAAVVIMSCILHSWLVPGG